MSRAKLIAALFATPLLAPLGARAESPAVPSVSIANVAVTEGNSGQTTFAASVTLYGWPQFTVKITATPGTASEGDYAFPPTELTLTQGVSQTITGSIIGDLMPEGDEYFTLTATPAGDGGYGPPLISSGGKITIVDDDQAQASRLYVDSLSLLEGDAGTSTAYVQVRLEPASANIVTVSYQTQDGTATSGQDYAATSGQLTFATGEVSKTIPIQIMGDTEWESNETFSVVLSQPAMALLGVGSGTVTIANDDPIAIPTIADMTVDEGDQGTKTVAVTMSFDRPVPAFAKVWYQLVGGGATADQDFRAVSTTLYPSTGATEITFTVDILSDTQPECDEGLLIQYAGRYGIDDATRVAKLILRNDDGPVAGCGDAFVPSTPIAQPLDGGATPPPSDSDAAPTTPEPIVVDAGTSLDGGVTTSTLSDAAVVPIPEVGKGDAAAVVSVPEVGKADSDTTPPLKDHIQSHSGCSLVAGGESGAASLLALLLGLLGCAFAVGRRRARK